jgi:hypothetical protein
VPSVVEEKARDMCRLMGARISICAVMAAFITANWHAQRCFGQDILTPAIQQADKLVLTYNEENILHAITVYKDGLTAAPENYGLLWRLARAYDAVLDIKTNQAMITANGLTDTPENKKLWNQYGKAALACSSKARQLQPGGIEGMAWQAISFAYYSSSLGIVKAIFSGAAKEFKQNAQTLIDRAPEYMGGLGYRHMGLFYLAAPFPLGSASKAEQYMLNALAQDPKYLQNHYYHGLALYRLKKYDSAQDEFMFVTENDPQIDEKQCDKAFKREARNLLDLISQKTKDRN